jgi:hypothetical protein
VALAGPDGAATFDVARAEAVLPLVARLLGLESPLATEEG